MTISVPVDAGKLRLTVEDRGHGPAVMLLHGFPDDRHVWRKQVPVLLSAGYRVIVPDQRGCGDSDMAQGVADYALPLLVDDLVAILDHLELRDVMLVGHDWGAVIGWHFAISHPDRVSRYAALSVGHPTAYARGPLEQKLKGYYVLLFQLRGIAERVLKAGNWRIFRSLTRQPDEVTRWISRLSRPGRLTAAINYYRANLGLLSTHDRPKATMPVMGVFSDGDRFLAAAQMQRSADFCTGPFRFERIGDAGHWLQLDAPDQINALLIDFLGKDDGA
jgi:pimeloyl-ACP methyl ester carboxylesterase